MKFSRLKHSARFFIVINFVIITSCNENILVQNYKPSTPHFLFPAEKGFYWEYSRYTPNIGDDTAFVYKNFNSFGIQTANYPVFRNTRLQVVDIADIKCNDTVYQCYVFDHFLYDQNKYSNFNKAYWFGDDGIYHLSLFRKGIDTVVNKGLYLPSVIPVNKSWYGNAMFIQDGRVSSTTVVDRKCLSKEEIIVTPAGKYRCYVIFTRESEADDYTLYIDTYEYYAPNIGLVCKVEIDMVPDTDYVPSIKGWWRVRFIDVLTNYSFN